MVVKPLKTLKNGQDRVHAVLPVFALIGILSLAILFFGYKPPRPHPEKPPVTVKPPPQRDL